MRFWDTSAIVPLLVDETATTATLAEYRQDPEQAVWWATEVECVSALARLERDGHLDSSAVRDALERLGWLAAAWLEVQPVDRVRRVATRLLRLHPLRAADALQLAAALILAEDEPASVEVVTLDDRLAQAAEREGCRVVIPSGPAR
jgi:predicted nucleic acid-binding protein